MKRALVAGAVALLALVLGACKPTFVEGGELEITDLGTAYQVVWPETVPVAAEEPVEELVILVDGVEVARLGSGAPSCVLYGLAPASDYEVSVQAVDSLDRVSDPLVTSMTTVDADGDGTSIICLPPITEL